MRLSLLFVAGWLLVGFAGCKGSDAPDRYPVTGTASFQDQPIEKGTILLLPEDGNGRPDGGDIVNGEFQLQSTPGKKRVEIRANVEVETPEDQKQPAQLQMETRTYKEIIPPRYNSASELTAEVEAKDQNRLEFKLE